MQGSHACGGDIADDISTSAAAAALQLATCSGSLSEKIWAVGPSWKFQKLMFPCCGLEAPGLCRAALRKSRLAEKPQSDAGSMGTARVGAVA
jgi:hypothetical protein